MSNANIKRRYNQQRSPQQSINTTSLFCLLTIIVLQHFVPANALVHPVFTYTNASDALDRAVTSTSSTLVWETYDSKNAKQLHFAVEGGKYITTDEHYPIYVCRVVIDGVSTSGHTEKVQQLHMCVAAHYKNRKYDNFDVLINKGHLGKVAWKHWRKFNAGVPVGAIRMGDDAYIARHRAPPSENGQHWGADYNLGRLDPDGLGKIKVVEHENEKDYDEGEVLVETEPSRYELREIKVDTLRMTKWENITELASTILLNRGDEHSLVETVMSYEFDHMQYWGTHEGVARGLVTKIFEKDVKDPAQIHWGLRYSEKRYETKSVQTKLQPGVALNVTLKGNYVTLEAPYTAKLYAFYAGSNDSVSRKITAEVRKSYLKDVKLEFSPHYWYENGTILPTTTTTSTTSTTTHATTTSTGEPRPVHEPPVVQMKDVGQTHSGPDILEKSLPDSSVSSNEIPNDMPENLAEKDHKLVLASISSNGGKNAAAATTIQQQLKISLAITTLCTAATLYLVKVV